MIQIKIKCIPTKELFRDFISHHRILSCSPLQYYPELKLNNYCNFTISGSNLDNLQLNQEANIVIEPDTKSKYEASYVMIGYEGVDIGEQGEIQVEPKYEYEILCRLMEPSQAKNVNEAYPNFVSLVLNNKQDTINFKNIKNVGQKRLDLYISKVQADCKAILFYPTAFDNGIVSGEDIRELQTHFNTPDELKNALSTNPYHVYVDLIGYSFDKADRLALKYHPEFIDSKERCEYGCLEILKENEYDGDTRINANLMASEARNLVPEAKHHMVEAVKDSKVIHYDEDTKYASIQATYEDESLIAEHILSRRNEPMPDFYPMNWQDFKTVDGFDCTDEQMAILKIVGEGGRVGILTGSGGTGKTSSVKALIRMLESNGHTYTLLAPTGVAAKRMRESTGRPASTIHMFLAHEDAEAGEYVIIDETSMVAVQLLAKLLNKIGKDPNLIFVCDEAQLASISCGNIVQDLIDSGKVPRANLTKVFRYGTNGLATIATNARMGTMDNLYKPFNDFKFVPISSNPIEQVLEEYDKLIEKGYKKDEILVLSPYNKGHKGTYEINKAIQSRYNANDYTFASYQRQGMGKIQFKVGDMVLNTKNNYRMPSLEMDEDGFEMFGEMQIMNGDIGCIRECRGDEKDPMLIVQFDEGMAAISGSDIANLLLGYSVTIHKCLTEDCLVLTNFGLKTIKDIYDKIQTNSKLLVYNGRDFEKPKNFFKNSLSKCKTITLKNGSSVTATYDHGLTTINSNGLLERINVEDVKLGDYIAIRKNSQVFGSSVNIESYLIEKNNKMKKEVNLPTELTTELATVLGLLCADGTVYKGGFRIAKRYEEIIDFMVENTKNIFEASGEKYFKVETSGGKNGAWYFEVNSRLISRWLLNFGGIGPNDKYVPQCILDAPKHIQCSFLKGLFEDGNVCVKNKVFDHIEFTTISKKCATQVQIMLLNMGIVSYLKKYKKAYHLYIYRNDALKFKDDIGFICNRKNLLLEDYLKSNEQTRQYSNNHIPNIKELCRQIVLNNPEIVPSNSLKSAIFYFKNEMTVSMVNRFVQEYRNIQDDKIKYIKSLVDDYMFYPVAGIQETIEDTYCLEMPETHQFIQNGFYGWNCQGAQNKAIIVVIDKEHKRLLSRNLMYVAFSRAQEYMVVIAEEEVLKEGLEVQENLERDTWLGDMLKEELDEICRF